MGRTTPRWRSLRPALDGQSRRSDPGARDERQKCCVWRDRARWRPAAARRTAPRPTGPRPRTIGRTAAAIASTTASASSVGCVEQLVPERVRDCARTRRARDAEAEGRPVSRRTAMRRAAQAGHQRRQEHGGSGLHATAGSSSHELQRQRDQREPGDGAEQRARRPRARPARGSSRSARARRPRPPRRGAPGRARCWRAERRRPGA